MKRKGLGVAGPWPRRQAPVRTQGHRLQGPVAAQLPDQRQGTGGARRARPQGSARPGQGAPG